MDHWSRRRLVQRVGVAGLGLLVGCGRLPGQAAPASRIARIGYLSPGSGPDPGADPFRQGLRDFGYVEGQNVAIEWRYAGWSQERFSELAVEVVELPVDVILATVSAAALAARSATSTIPVVFVNAGDPVRLGLVADLARPGGNATGLSSLSVPLGQKRLELLKEIAPQAARIAAFYDAADPASVAALSDMIDAARVLGITLEPFGVRADDELDGAFEAAIRLPADALITSTGGLLGGNEARIVDFAARDRLPAVYNLRAYVEAGGLVSYATNFDAQYRRAAYYVDRILKGASPADLPVEQPTTFELVVNLKTAQALGLTIPPHVLLQATEVLQ